MDIKIIVGFLVTWTIIVIWCVRLEQKVLSNETIMNTAIQNLQNKDETLQKDHESVRDKLYEKFSEVQKLLYEIKGQLSNNNNRGV